MQRLDLLASTDDGFELARQDLAMRHEGDILGSRQSGLPSMPLVDIERDREIIEQAHLDARSLVAYDPDLSSADHAPLGARVRQLIARIEEGDA